MKHKKLSKTPLTYVLAKINFSNIEAIEKFIPDIQEGIRHTFPNFRKVTVQFVEVRENQQPSILTRTQWHFMDKDSVTGIFLDNTSVAIHTSKYTQFETLSNQFQSVLEKFSQILQISLLTRIGLRYINLIENNLTQYINPGLLGFHLEDTKYFKPERFLTNIDLTEEGKYGIIKIQSSLISNKEVINNINIFVPADLTDVANLLSFNHQSQPNGKFLVLDLDHFNNNKEDFEINIIMNNLKNLQEALYQAFCAAVTEKALVDWK